MASFLDYTPLSGFFYNPEDDQAKALEGILEGKRLYSDIPRPDYQNVNFGAPERAKDISVSDIDPALVGSSAYENISLDPELRKQQLAQLNVLEMMRDRGGFTAADEANLARARNEAAMSEKAQRSAIMQQAQMRGMGDSRAALLEQMLASQSGANRLSRESLDIAGMGQQRAMQAGQNAAALAGGMESADWQRQAAAAQAADTINKFNADTSNMGLRFNAEQKLKADLVNKEALQNYYNTIADINMKKEMANKVTIPGAQSQFDLARAGGMSDIGKAQAAYYGNLAQAKAQQQGNLWGSAAQLGGALIGDKGLKGLFGGGGSGTTTTAAPVNPTVSNSGSRWSGTSAGSSPTPLAVGAPLAVSWEGLSKQPAIGYR